jgi:hypothetical protein
MLNIRYLLVGMGILCCGLGLAPVTAAAASPSPCVAGQLIPCPNDPVYANIQAQPATGCATTQDTSDPTAGQPINTQCQVNTIINRLLDDAYYLMGAISILLLIAAGIRYITANGNAEATKKARQSIFNIILGIVLLTAAWVIVNLITGTAGSFTANLNL